eukprot:9490642-Pyramimonas_sp.AAC.1
MFGGPRSSEGSAQGMAAQTYHLTVGSTNSFGRDSAAGKQRVPARAGLTRGMEKFGCPSSRRSP